MSALVFVETAEGASQLLTLRRNGGLKDATVVALSPWAAYELEQAGMGFVQPNDVMDPAYRAQLADANLARALQLAQIVDQTVQMTVLGGGRSFRPAYGELFFLKILLDAASIRVKELRSLIQAHKPSRIAYIEVHSAYANGQRLDFMGESIYNMLLPLAAAESGIHCERLGDARWPYTPPEWSRPVTAAAAVQRAARLVGPAISGFRKSSRAATVLALDSCLSRSLARSRSHRLILWRAGAARALRIGRIPRLLDARVPVQPTPPEAFRLCWDRLTNDEAFRRLVDADAPFAAAILMPKLEYFVREVAPLRLQTYSTATELLRRWQVRAVLAYSYAHGPERAVAQAANSSGVPVIAYDHGALGYFIFPIERHLDQGIADYRLVWGDGVRAHIENRFDRSASPMVVGSDTLDILIRRSPEQRARTKVRLCRHFGFNPDRPVILYCVTSLGVNMQYADQPVAADMIYSANQLRILRCLARFPRYQVLLKLHPTALYPRPPAEDFARETGLTSWRVSSTDALSEILDVADLLINDSPTTTLLQMMTTQTPMIVFQSAMRLEPQAIEPLHNATFLTDDIDVLVDELAHRLESGNLRVSRPRDTSFIKSYGTYLHDGGSAGRAVAALDQAIASYSRRLPVTQTGAVAR